jgi:hypothetical protein
MLKETKKTLKEVEKLRTGTSTTQDHLQAPGQSEYLHAQLFKSLFALSEQKKASKILCNILSAALHLSFMLRGYGDDKSFVSATSLPSTTHNQHMC